MTFPWALLAIALFAMHTGPSQGSNPVGSWRGDSKCVMRPSACNDEDALYRFYPGKAAGLLLLDARKMVNGEAQRMSDNDAECRHDAATHSVDCVVQPGGPRVHVEIDGDRLTGTMTRGEGTLWRKLALTRVKSK